MTLCYLGLGSNLRSPVRQLRQGLVSLHKLPRSAILKLSSLYFSQPCGVRSQPPYCNLVISIQTSLPPHRLLHYCQAIENKQQRVRKKPGCARTLDIDILFYGKRIINTPNLTIPHPALIYRDFVLVPLLEISPSPFLPNGQSIYNCLKKCHRYLTPNGLAIRACPCPISLGLVQEKPSN